MAISRQQIDEWFGDKSKPNIAQKDCLEVEQIRMDAKRFALTIVSNSKPSSDQSVAVRKVREAMSSAFDAIRFGD
jgi:hypothetical protein